MDSNLVMIWDIDKDGEIDMEIHISKKFLRKISIRIALWILRKKAGIGGGFL